MPNLHLSTQPILSTQIPALAPAFKRLQGNVLKSLGRDHAINIFVHFTKPKANGEDLLEKVRPVNHLGETIEGAPEQSRVSVTCRGTKRNISAHREWGRRRAHSGGVSWDRALNQQWFSAVLARRARTGFSSST